MQRYAQTSAREIFERPFAFVDHASRKLRTIVLLAGDIALLYLSLAVTLQLRYGFAHEPSLWHGHLAPFTVVFALWLVVFAIGGLYDLRATGSRAEVAFQLLGSLAVAGVIAATFFYLGSERLFTLRPQRVLVIELGVAFALLFAWRSLVVWALRSPRLARRVLIVGSHAIIPELISELVNKPQLGFLPVAWVRPQTGNGSAGSSALTVYPQLRDLAGVCRRHHVDLIISDISPRHHPTLLHELLACLPLRVDCSDLSTFYERITGKVPVDAIEQVWFLENLHEGTKRAYEWAKWLADVVLATGFLVITLPFLPLLYIAVKLDSRGPFLFTQTRVGQAGKKFLAMKIRTMVVNAELNGAQWASRDDRRVTRVGGWLRKFRLDEIPQLWNVLRGEMSLIGPRPERPEFIAQLSQTIPFYEERLLVKPGLTGWAQVNFPYGASVEEALEKLQYDLFYIKHRSLGVDVSILLRTIGTILSRSGR